MQTEMKEAIAFLRTMRLPYQPPRRQQQKTVELPEPRRSQKWHKVRVVLQEIVFLAIALDLVFLAWYYLALWPIYRFIAYIIIVILWSNFASTTVHTIAKKQTMRMLTTMSMPAVRLRNQHRTQQPAVTADTTTYLKALRAGVERRRR